MRQIPPGPAGFRGGFPAIVASFRDAGERDSTGAHRDWDTLSADSRMAGYSGTPLPRKLGLKPNARFGVFNAPKHFEELLGDLPQGATLRDAARGSSRLDVIVCFVSSLSELERVFPRARKRLDPNGGLWLCWPKKASGIKTDVSENAVRNLGLAASLVDNKVCAIDEVWSGLRMVVRSRDRPE